MKEKFLYILEVKKVTEVCNILEISNYEFSKLREKVEKNYVLNDYENKLIDKMLNACEEELEFMEIFKEVSLVDRISNLVQLLTKYHKKVDVARYIGISDTHLNRLLSGLDKVKYNVETYKKLLEMYNNTEIMDFDIIPFEKYQYTGNKINLINFDNILNIEMSNLKNLNLDMKLIKKEVINLIEELREHGYKYTEIAKYLGVSNSLIHITLRGNFPKKEEKTKLMYLKLIKLKENLFQKA